MSFRPGPTLANTLVRRSGEIIACIEDKRRGHRGQRDALPFCATYPPHCSLPTKKCAPIRLIGRDGPTTSAVQ